MLFISKNSTLSLILFHRLRFRLLILLTSFTAAFFGILAPYFQKEFIDSVTGETQLKIHFLDFSSPWPFVFLAFITYLLSQAFTQWTNFLGMQEAIRMQRILSEKIYEKTLSLKVDTLSQRPLGEIVSIYATDVPGATVILDQTLPFGASTLFPLLLTPFVLIFMFEAPLWPTFLAMFLVSALNTTLAFRQSKYFFQFKQLAAERIGLVNEWIQNIRALRILGWTAHFEKTIFKKRQVETLNRVKMVTNGQIMNSISSSFTFLLNIMTLGVLVFVSNQKLTSGEILALLWILGVFLTRPFRQMPWFFTFAFDSWTSVKRLDSFFDTKNEKTPLSPMDSTSKKILRSQRSSDQPPALEVKNLNLTVRGHKILRHISFQVQPKEFVGIVGDVGSGKSLLLLSLLGETGASWDFYQGPAKEKLAFVPQEGFIMSASLRDNVIFDYDQNPDRDKSVEASLEACEFNWAYERTVGGLETQLGERGVNLSGGQKQRVNLARVDFNSGDVLLLDDCFSALDVDTEKLILDRLILGRWKNKTRILVTHRLSVLEKVDRILFLEQGEIVEEGTFEELTNTSEKFREFTRSIQNESPKEAHVDPIIIEGK